MLACTVMPMQVIAVIGIANSALLPTVLPPMGAIALAGLVTAGFMYLRQRKSSVAHDELVLHNPFELGSALKFGLLFAVVLFATKVAQIHLGHQGTYATGFLAGATDMDAITLSMANFSGHGLAPSIAATTILLAA